MIGASGDVFEFPIPCCGLNVKGTSVYTRNECTPPSRHLQNQGMKINLSLTEMSQFFMKMADAVKKKKLKPGASIPGCNSYFLCKFLKDTMLQAR